MLWSEYEASLAEVTARFPLPTGTAALSYGTAGFRTTATLLSAAACRLAAVCALRSLVCGGKAVGLMITASHNPAADNGIKIVDHDGGMLTRDWEPFATDVVNASDGAALLAVVRNFTTARYADALQSAAGSIVVHVGRDTRPSGVDLLAAFKAGMSAIGALDTVVDHGEVTTPQLHTMVNLHNTKGAAPTVADYYSQVANAFVELNAEFTQSTEAQKKLRVAIDFGNGVGVCALRALLKTQPQLKDIIDFQLVNTSIENPEILNHLCGADYVQKAKVPPAAFESLYTEDPDTLFFSFDGDADRVVAFHLSADGSHALLDGDRIAILIARLVFDILQPVEMQQKESLDVGIVQTAYANGASTAYVQSELKLKTYCAATGVKFLHPIAEHRDIGIYFEANGHGTALFNMKRLRDLLGDSLAFKQIDALSKLLSQSCGDAIGDMLACVLALKKFQWRSKDWLSMYSDLPSLQTKILVPFPKRILCTPDEKRATAPAGLQDAIDTVLLGSGDKHARGFVRPSGTEPLVRLYVEAFDAQLLQPLAEAIDKIVKPFCS